ncbi:hypothetical protein EVA_14748 [gut metagenome]|uniref:Uncharacterized protein n=1 Tax=gut metagenome TaxID=749906 RepID=J9FRM8_9ZZZZ
MVRIPRARKTAIRMAIPPAITSFRSGFKPGSLILSME